jgi:Saccharopine dehydrogenase NADP binding domain
MSRVLVIGGYGGFGARLSRRLLAAGHAVLVGGRSADKARRFCEGHPRAESVVIDRCGELAGRLRELRPDIVIDAAGPFQNSSFAVAQASIEAGAHYLDLADARGFVCGIGALDEPARAAGVAVISGASTVPALSSAVVLHLARGLSQVEKVEMALSAATHSTASASVAGAVLSYLGQEIPAPHRGGGPTFGWQSLRWCTYRIPGIRPLNRFTAMVDVPDYQLLPDLIPGKPDIEFRAGTDVSLHMIALWLASWPVRWGWLRTPERFSDELVKLQRRTAIGRGERSAMSVRLTGLDAASRVDLNWTIIAEDSDGPEIPTIAAALLADDLEAGRFEPGARTAAGLLSLERFEAAFAPLAMHHHTEASYRTRILEPAALGAA